MPHNQASVQPFLPSTSSSSPHFPPVHQSQSSDLAVPAVARPPPSTVDGPLSSSQESSLHGNSVCLASETSFTDSPQTPSVRTQHTRPPACGAARLEKAPPFPSWQVCCWPAPISSMDGLGSLEGHRVKWEVAAHLFPDRSEACCANFPTNRVLSVHKWIGDRLETQFP